MMSAAGSGGLAAPIFFAAGGLVFLAGSAASEDTSTKVNGVEVNKSSSPVFDVTENNSSLTRSLHQESSTIVDNNKTFVPYEMLKITVSDVKKEDINETIQDK